MSVDDLVTKWLANLDDDSRMELFITKQIMTASEPPDQVMWKATNVEVNVSDDELETAGHASNLSVGDLMTCLKQQIGSLKKSDVSQVADDATSNEAAIATNTVARFMLAANYFEMFVSAEMDDRIAKVADVDKVRDRNEQLKAEIALLRKECDSMRKCRANDLAGLASLKKQAMDGFLDARATLKETRIAKEREKQQLRIKICDQVVENNSLLKTYWKLSSLNTTLRTKLALARNSVLGKVVSPLAMDCPVQDVEQGQDRPPMPMLPDITAMEGSEQPQEQIFSWKPPCRDVWYQEKARLFGLPVARRVSIPEDFGKPLNLDDGPLPHNTPESAGGGQCLFHVASQFLSVEQNFNWEIRSLVCDFVQSNASVLKEFYPGEDYETYKSERMVENAEDPKWAEHIDLFALACLLGIDIWVYAPSFDKGPCDHWYRVSPPHCLKTDDYAMYVLNQNREHFQLITAL